MVRPTDRRQEMKADRDDAPEHLRRKQGQSFGKWTLAIALGLGLSGLALHMAGNKLSFLPKPQSNQPSNLEKPAHAPDDNTPQNQPQKTSEELFGKVLMHAIINRTSLSKLFITIVITGRKSRPTSTHRQHPIEQYPRPSKHSNAKPIEQAANEPLSGSKAGMAVQTT